MQFKGKALLLQNAEEGATTAPTTEGEISNDHEYNQI
jgi:hypothetical protein